MNVELAEERVLVFNDRFTMDHAEGRAWAKRIEAFGTLAKIGGFLQKPREDEYEQVYRERRLQPFWRIRCSATYVYERTRDYAVPVPAEVRAVTIANEERLVADRCFRLTGLESCREELERDSFYDALTRAETPALGEYLKYEAVEASPEALAAATAEGIVVVPPEAKASQLVREAMGGVIAKFEADKVLEEQIRVEAVDLMYRPVYAFRYRRQGKEAVVEFDGLTGEAKPGGATFEQYVGKILEPRFLLEAGVEAADIFIPGAQLARVIVTKGLSTVLEARKKAP